jgi:hypothetical protein
MTRITHDAIRGSIRGEDSPPKEREDRVQAGTELAADGRPTRPSKRAFIQRHKLEDSRVMTTRLAQTLWRQYVSGVARLGRKSFSLKTRTRCFRKKTCREALLWLNVWSHGRSILSGGLLKTPRQHPAPKYLGRFILVATAACEWTLDSLEQEWPPRQLRHEYPTA